MYEFIYALEIGHWYATYLLLKLNESFIELPIRSFLALRQDIQRLGSLVKPLDAKNS